MNMTRPSAKGAASLVHGEDRLHWLLGRLVHAHARLDLNVGLQLRWLGPYCGLEVDHLLVTPNVKMKTRLDKLRALSLTVWAQSNPAARDAFEQWFVRAERARALRNDYAHGRWGAVSFRQPDLFSFVALSWEFDPDEMAPAVQITLAELEAQVGEIESLGRDFLALQRAFENNAELPYSGARRKGS